jgi:hypothetical protein
MSSAIRQGMREVVWTSHFKEAVLQVRSDKDVLQYVLVVILLLALLISVMGLTLLFRTVRH